MNDHIKKTVLEKIQAGDITMRPRVYFILKMALVVIIALIVLLTSAFFISFISFSLRVSGRLILLGFGWHGIEVFLLTFPWGILLIDLVFVVILERLLRTFKFGYRSPLVYLLGALVVVVVVAGLAIDQTPFHAEMWHAERSGGAPPFFGGMYDMVRQPPHAQGVFRGTVISMSIATAGGPAFFILKSDDNDSDIDDTATTSQLWKIFFPPNVSTMYGLMSVSVGDQVLVAGNVLPDGVHEYGIEKVSSPDTF
jgi:hypothetical protein